jgi:hypothetical protein
MARAAIFAQVRHRKQLKVRPIESPVFWWDFDVSEKITRSMVTYYHQVVWREAKIEDFRFHDRRHV